MTRSGERPFVGSLVARSRLRRAVERAPNGAAWRSPRFWHATRRGLIGPSCPAARSCTSRRGRARHPSVRSRSCSSLRGRPMASSCGCSSPSGSATPAPECGASTNARTANSMGDSRHDVVRARRLRHWPVLGMLGGIAVGPSLETCRLATCVSRLGPIAPRWLGHARRPERSRKRHLRSPAKPRAAVSRRFAVARASLLIGRLMLRPRAIHR